MHGLFQTRLVNHFDRTRWNSLVTRLKWNLVSVCLETVLVSVQDRCTVSALWYHSLRNHFGRIRWNTVVTWVKWNLVSVCLETVLAFVQDRCMVCAKHTIGSEIVLDTMMVLLCIKAQVDARFGLFGHSAKLDAR